MSKIKYLIFDIESVADPNLVAKIHYPGESIDPKTAVRKYRDELMQEHGSDFIPYTFQIPISVAIAKVTDDFEMTDLVVLDEPHFRPHEITRRFWRGWTEYYGRPTLVSFNGRGFDLPLLELAAFRYAIPIPNWFATESKSFDQPRNRYNSRTHLDLYDLLTNYGATRLSGGLNLISNLLGKPGKMGVQGCMVQDMYDAGKLQEINDYCRCDVLDTYFVFLRMMLLLGHITLEREQELVRRTKHWLEERPNISAYLKYLENWGDWTNPWEEEIGE
ncbi:MAG: 3'-5' exonuclease [Thermoguttaceae bacterium]